MINPSEVLFRESALQEMINHVKKHSAKSEETVISLIGTIHQNRIYEITRTIIDAPKCQRGAVSCSTDEKHVSAILQEELEKNPDSRYLGDFHLHPWPVTPEPSSIDYDQLSQSKKSRNWFIIGVFSSTGELRVFGMKRGEEKNGLLSQFQKDELVEIPYRIVPDGFDGKEDHLSRINKVTSNDILGKSRILVVGCGSLGSAVITGMAGTGTLDYVVADMGDTLSIQNTIRHVGQIKDVDKAKTAIFQEYIQSHQPLARVQTIDADLVKDAKLLRQLIEWSDVVISASGNPQLHYVINSLCVELKKPAVYGGIFAKAKEAYVFYYSAKNDDDACCWECIMNLATAEISQDVINRKYGLENGELQAEQGLNCDIAIPGLFMTKIVLDHLMQNKIEYNLIQYSNTPGIHKNFVTKKDTCAICNYPNWIKSEQEKLCDDNDNSKDNPLHKITYSISKTRHRLAKLSDGFAKKTWRKEKQ